MSDDNTAAAPPAPVDFIRSIVAEDVATGKHGGRVATRFPPEPNGYLHIGHAKSICLNFGVAEETGGTCTLRFDDTNPAKEDVEYVDAIQEDVAWLGFKWDALRFASDYFERLYEFALEVAEHGIAEHVVTAAGVAARCRTLFGAGRAEVDEANRLRNGQRPEEHLVEQREDRGVRADAQRQRDDRDERDKRGPEEGAAGKLQVDHENI